MTTKKEMIEELKPFAQKYWHTTKKLNSMPKWQLQELVISKRKIEEVESMLEELSKEVE